jgi:hypothetical protein
MGARVAAASFTGHQLDQPILGDKLILEQRDHEGGDSLHRIARAR